MDRCEWIVIVYDYPIFVGNTQLLIVVRYFNSMICMDLVGFHESQAMQDNWGFQELIWEATIFQP